MKTTPNSRPDRRTTGVLLVNVGTPDSPTSGDVRRYLRQFLSDRRVLNMNPVGRWLLLNLVILPFRPRRSAEAYRSIWRDDGSPLLIHTRSLEAAMQDLLGPDYRVRIGMRYGTPSILDALNTFRREGIGRIVIFPLFPQYASSTTGTALEEALSLLSKGWNVPEIHVVAPFHDDPGFLAAFAETAAETLADVEPDHVLFSFHGLPESHILLGDVQGGHCLASDDCCAEIIGRNRDCYRAQCFATARGIAGRLGLVEESWSVSFQSRLGRAKWIEPYTTETVEMLARRGIRRLAVLCPSFVADCLETLEEIGIRARSDFLAAGGEQLLLVPSLNGRQSWIEAAASLVRKAL